MFKPFKNTGRFGAFYTSLAYKITFKLLQYILDYPSKLTSIFFQAVRITEFRIIEEKALSTSLANNDYFYHLE